MKKVFFALIAALLLCSACSGLTAQNPGREPGSITSGSGDDSNTSDKVITENTQLPQKPSLSPSPQSPQKPSPSPSPQSPQKPSPSPSPQPASDNDYQDKLVFHNKPLIEHLLMSAADVRQEFGVAIFDGAGPYAYLFEYSGFEIFLPFDEWRGMRDVVTGIRIYDSGLLSVNGDTLDKDLTVIRTALGESTYEGWHPYDGDEIYVIEYVLWESPAPMILLLYTDGPSGDLLKTTIRFYDDGPYPESPPWQKPYVYPSLVLTDAIRKSTAHILIVINWIEDGRTTTFERAAGSNDWIMHSRDGTTSTVYPTFPKEIGIIKISFPTTSKLYYLYDYLTGEFGDEKFTWEYTIG